MVITSTAPTSYWVQTLWRMGYADAQYGDNRCGVSPAIKAPLNFPIGLPPLWGLWHCRSLLRRSGKGTHFLILLFIEGLKIVPLGMDRFVVASVICTLCGNYRSLLLLLLWGHTCMSSHDRSQCQSTNDARHNLILT